MTSSASEMHRARPQIQSWQILGLLMALCFISHFNRASITSAGDERIIQQFSISPERMGVVYSAFLLTYTLCMIPAGWFIDRGGPRVALLCMGIGSAIFCACTGAIGMGFIAGSQVWFALLIVRALMGALSAPLHPGAARAVASWFGRDSQSSANGLITGASIFAYAVVHPVFGKLIESIDWPHAFLITGGLTAMLAILWYVMAVEPRSNISAPQPQSNPSAPSVPLSPASEEPANRQRRQKSLALLTLSYAAVGYFQYLFFYWLHYYFDSVLHMDKEQSRFYAGLPNLAMAIGMPIGGWFTGWVERNWGQKHRVWVPGIGMFLSSLCLAGGITSHAPGWIVGWFTASLGILGVCEAAFWTTAVGLGGQKGGGTSAAIMNTGGNAIGLLAPMVTPLVSQRLGWTWGIGFGGLIGILGALCWLGIQPEKETSHERIS